MPPTAISSSEARAASPKHFATQLPIIAQDWTELLMVEVPKERGRRLRVIPLALGVAVFGFLSRAALTAALVVIFWSLSLMAVLLAVATRRRANAVGKLRPLRFTH